MLATTVKVHGVISKFVASQENEFRVHLPEGSTVSDLIREVGIPREDIWLVVMDGARTSLNALVKNESLIELFSPVVGG